MFLRRKPSLYFCIAETKSNTEIADLHELVDGPEARPIIKIVVRFFVQRSPGATVATAFSEVLDPKTIGELCRTAEGLGATPISFQDAITIDVGKIVYPPNVSTIVRGILGKRYKLREQDPPM